MSKLQIKELSKSYGATTILQIKDFIFNEGLYHIKGKNGSGKTTLFDSLAGLIPFEGTVTLDGNSVQSKAYKLKVNYSQATPLFPQFLTGKSIIDLFARLKQASDDQKESLIELFEVDRYMHKEIGAFSSGMLKKLSIVTAFLGSPDWIILDEPFITLDVKSQSSLLNLIREIPLKGTSFLIATHQDSSQNQLPESIAYELIEGELILEK